MIPLLLAWTLLTVSFWTQGSSQILIQETVKDRYPVISSTETIDCECSNFSCDHVYWFLTIPHKGTVTFLAKSNTANRVTYKTANETRFKFSKRGTASFVLRIIGVTEADAGIYSCVLKDRSNAEIWRPGTRLRPGVTPPTPPPKTKPTAPVKSVCRCSRNNRDGCGYMVLWPLVGLLAALALILVCTLYYFSRLPKKCRHHFVKKRQMT
ncbi:uncharacterized protein cd8b [Embiotoca jacksoni]|uniref:uncharacterized protein cd8b n=1 Tax=Embiotoca jacksoni TaxID=100190 RepID=UPI003703860A